MIYPAAVWSPGLNAGYRAGHCSMGTVVCHFSVGKNSTAIGIRGYFQFLVGRDGAVTQFAEADAVCWHAGDPWNSRGPGVEVEYLPGVDDEIFTPEGYAATALLCQWLHDTYSIPLDFYDGPRVSFHDGFITHRSLIQSGDAHSDYWPELPRVQVPGDDDMKPMLMQPIPAGTNDPDQGKTWMYNPYAHTKTWIRSNDALNRAIALFGPPDPDPANAAIIADARTVDDPGAVIVASLPASYTLTPNP